MFLHGAPSAVWPAAGAGQRQETAAAVTSSQRGLNRIPWTGWESAVQPGGFCSSNSEILSVDVRIMGILSFSSNEKLKFVCQPSDEARRSFYPPATKTDPKTPRKFKKEKNRKKKWNLSRNLKCFLIKTRRPPGSPSVLVTHEQLAARSRTGRLAPASSALPQAERPTSARSSNPWPHLGKVCRSFSYRLLQHLTGQKFESEGSYSSPAALGFRWTRE